MHSLQAEAHTDTRGGWDRANSLLDFLSLERWALIVGISKYQNKIGDLQYADCDAEAFYDRLRTPSGGGFAEKNIYKLINEEATTAAITKGLRSFLKKPPEKSLVVLYLACHGAPDPDRLSDIYLLSYDTDPQDIAGTAVPMRDLTFALSETLQARWVVVIVDTCHSGAIDPSIRRGRAADNSVAILKRYQENISQAKPGVYMITSAQANQSAQEGKDWGGGHGVFTHYLLQGMQGDADVPPDGIVRLKELYEYVRTHVQKDTNNQQDPWGSGNLDPWLPMAVTGGAAAQQYYQLGCGLHDLGQRLAMPYCFQSAVGLLKAARNVADGPYPEALLQEGIVLFSANRFTEAVVALRDAVKGLQEGRAPSAADSLANAHFYLGLAHARIENYGKAVHALQTFVQLVPHDDRVAWVQEYLAQITPAPVSHKYALIIGIDLYEDLRIPSLRGRLRDVQAVNGVLTELWGFPPENITLLTGTAATRQGILDAFTNLHQQTRPPDAIVVYYSGQAIGSPAEAYLLVKDSKRETNGQATNAITTQELHAAMDCLPAAGKTLILETDAHEGFLDLVKKNRSYSLLMGTAPGQRAQDRRNPEGAAGVFTVALLQALQRAAGAGLTYGQLMTATAAAMDQDAEAKNQTPLLLGTEARTVFHGEGQDLYLRLFDFSAQRNSDVLESAEVQEKYAWAQSILTASFPQLHYSAGRAFLEKGSYTAAIDALQRALDQRGEGYPDAQLALGFAQLGADQSAEAESSLQAWLSTGSEDGQSGVHALLTHLEHIAGGQKHALLVGITSYKSPELPGCQGAITDVLALQAVLLERYGFQKDNIVMLLDAEATRTAILDAFTDLVKKAQAEPSLFYFAGIGSTTTDLAKTIISTDGRQLGVFDIDLAELYALLTGDNTYLTTIIDTGWTTDGTTIETRTVPPDKHSPGRRGSAKRALWTRIGRAAIYPDSISIATPCLQDTPAPTDNPVPTGILTHALVTALRAGDAQSLMYSSLQTTVAEGGGKLMLAVDPDTRVFGYNWTPAIARDLFARVDSASVQETIKLLDLVRESIGSHWPEGYVNRGLAYALRRQFEAAVADLKTATEQQPSNPDARYYLGRVLFESNSDLNRATSELETAVKQDPDNVGAYYYLGQTIRTLIERKTYTKAEKALRIYLERGAPLGHETEVRAFLEAR